VQKEICSICSSAGLTVYGSFAKGTFHLDSEAWNTYSDLDLTSQNAVHIRLPEQITAEIERRLGLLIKTKIRQNINHVDKLPLVVSQQLSFIDTAIMLMRGVETRSLYHYLIVKYLLRTVYLNRYVQHEAAIAEEHDDALFSSLMQYKTGNITNLSIQDLHDITFRLKVVHAAQFCRLLSLLSLRKVNELAPYWFSFCNCVKRFGLSDLLEDISQKMEMAKCAVGDGGFFATTSEIQEEVINSVF